MSLEEAMEIARDAFGSGGAWYDYTSRTPEVEALVVLYLHIQAVKVFENVDP